MRPFAVSGEKSYLFIKKTDYLGKIWEGVSTVGYILILIISVVYLVTETYHPFLYFRF